MKIKCNICEKEYKSSVAMKRHFNTKHDGINNLDNVKYIYTNDECLDVPYECDICGFRSKRKESIVRHKNGSHLNTIDTVKTIKCVICGELLIANLIKKHIATHELSNMESFVAQHSSVNPAKIPIYLTNHYYTSVYHLGSIYTKQIKSFISMLDGVKDITKNDINNFLINVLPFKLKNPKICNSRNLADLVGLTSDERNAVYDKMVEINPFTGHGSELSAFSNEFNGYIGLSDDVIGQRIADAKQYDRDDRSQSQYKYWMGKGYSEDDAKLKVSEVQKTFSLDICIEKYGTIEGTKRWKDRQSKWLKSIDTPEIQQVMEDGRIKGYHVSMIKNGNVAYSKISQELFHYIYNKILDKYSKVYFATLGEPNRNNEYHVKLHNGRSAFLDFYIKDVNKVIEFDGDYWHGARGNKTRDDEREQLIKESIDGIQILRIREHDYNNDKTGTVQKCIDFISG